MPLRRHSNGGTYGGGAAIYLVLVARYFEANADNFTDSAVAQLNHLRGSALLYLNNTGVESISNATWKLVLLLVSAEVVSYIVPLRLRCCQQEFKATTAAAAAARALAAAVLMTQCHGRAPR